MNIPIQNIYYLLCYAWDKLAERDVVAVEAIDNTSLADLFARVLINGTNHLLKRGFDRGYVSQHEWTGRLRGRICFQEAIRRNATIDRQAALRFRRIELQRPAQPHPEGHDAAVDPHPGTGGGML